MKRRTIVFISIIFFIGLGVLLYPTISNYVNQLHQGNVIINYDKKVSMLSKKDYSDAFRKAEEYNKDLLTKKNRFRLSEEEQNIYNSILNVTGNGIIGYIEIKKLGVKLSITHGVGEKSLEEGIGHMEGTSMPCGGESTHAVLVGHRGLPSAKLFTDLDQMEEGDIFTIHLLNRTLTYQVCKITVVEPSDMKDLDIEKGKDYVTLVTCTPYAVNTHRLLVRGVRIDTKNEMDGINNTMTETQVKQVYLADYVPVIVAVILLTIFNFLIIRFFKMRKRQRS